MPAFIEASPPVAEGSAPRARRPVDLVHLSRVTFGNRALEREVLELFLAQSGLYLRRLLDARGEQAWRDAAHTINGSARAIGACQVVAAAEAAEALPSLDRSGERVRLLGQIERHIEDANAFIRALLADS